MNEQISAVLDELSMRFGATGAELWAELVRYEVVTALAFPVSTLILCVTLGYGAFLCWHKYKTNGAVWDIPAIMLFVFATIMFVATVIGFSTAAATLAAPQAAVLRSFLS